MNGTISVDDQGGFAVDQWTDNDAVHHHATCPRILFEASVKGPH